MNPGYTSKEIQRVLRLKTVGSVTDAVRPQARKMLRLFLADPVKFVQWIRPMMEEVAMEMVKERADESTPSTSCDDCGISPQELFLREDLLRGRVDRQRVHPQATRDAGTKARRHEEME